MAPLSGFRADLVGVEVDAFGLHRALPAGMIAKIWVMTNCGMTDRDYVERLKGHLAAYRLNELHVRDTGSWGSPPRAYGHILPPGVKEKNIVAAHRERFWKVQAGQHWTLHQYFHHLSSSQALAFNLFFAGYPQLPKTFAAFRRVLQLDLATPYAVNFEVVLDDAENNNDGENTNIDVLLTDADGRRTIIEIKLTEGSFGRAKNDQRHLKKLRKVYYPRLTGRVTDECLEPKTFFKDYQLFRNVAQIRRGSSDRVVFLIPRKRARLWQHATEWSLSPRLGVLRQQVAVIAIEDVIEALREDSSSPEMPAGLATQVSLKYSLAEPALVSGDGSVLRRRGHR